MYKILVGDYKTVEKELNDLNEKFETIIEAYDFDKNYPSMRVLVKCYEYFNKENNYE